MIQTIIFSKNRALQLYALIESIYHWINDANDLHINVFYKATTPKHVLQYKQVSLKFPHIHLIAETHFRQQLLALIPQYPWIFFLVDDALFYRPFAIHPCIAALSEHPDALSVNFLLGANTTYCYPQNAAQPIPPLEPVPNTPFVKFRWQDASYDFGYPLEISGSLYRTATILELISQLPFDHPNRLEAALSQQTSHISHLPWRLIFPESVGFCYPLNRVQHVFANRVAEQSVDAEQLADWFDQGQRLDVKQYHTMTPNAVHFDAPLLLRQESISVSLAPEPPRISAIIPVYNGAAFLPQAVGSLVAQQYTFLEIIIVNDGSTDNSLLVAHSLAAKYDTVPIRVIDKNNVGPADARNIGIQQANGEWILPLDCDDCFVPEFLHHAVQVITAHPEINLLFSNVQEFGARNNTWIPSPYSWNELCVHNTFPYASLYPRKLWEMAGGYDPSLPWGAEDWNFWISCAPFGIKSYRFEKPFFHYRIHSHSSTSTGMRAHWAEVVACLHTLHPTVYPLHILLADHATIAAMHSDTVERIERIITCLPHLSMPYFWRGLVHEAAGRLPEAIADYTRAAGLVPYAQWQPHLRLFLLNRKLNRRQAAKQTKEECLHRNPLLREIFEQLPPL